MVSSINAFGAGIGLGSEQSKSSIDRGNKLLEKALSSKAVLALYEKANSTPTYNYDSHKSETGQWSVEFVEKIPGGFGANCNRSKRKINLAQASSDETALSYFVFELTNAVNHAQHQMAWRKACSGQMECEEYAKEKKRIEYDGCLIHHKVMSEAIKEMGWSKKLDIYSNCDGDFEKDWNWQKDTPHADYYREDWKRVNPGKSAPEMRNCCFRTIQKISHYFGYGTIRLW